MNENIEVDIKVKDQKLPCTKFTLKETIEKVREMLEGPFIDEQFYRDIYRYLLNLLFIESSKYKELSFDDVSIMFGLPVRVEDNNGNFRKWIMVKEVKATKEARYVQDVNGGIWNFDDYNFFYLKDWGER